jgi:hypothetical protein
MLMPELSPAELVARIEEALPARSVDSLSSRVVAAWRDHFAEEPEQTWEDTTDREAEADFIELLGIKAEARLAEVRWGQRALSIVETNTVNGFEGRDDVPQDVVERVAKASGLEGLTADMIQQDKLALNSPEGLKDLTFDEAAEALAIRYASAIEQIFKSGVGFGDPIQLRVLPPAEGLPEQDHLDIMNRALMIVAAAVHDLDPERIRARPTNGRKGEAHTLEVILEPPLEDKRPKQDRIV